MNTKYILIGILVIAAAFRIFGLSRGDPVNDEALLAFRAIGPMDFDLAEFQTTPLEWFDPVIPWWTSLSFHDHPPLVFWIQHLFIKIFGENLFAVRLPSVLFGVASIYLLYLLGATLYSREIGLIAAALLAVTVNHVYIARIGLQESYVIFFLLLTLYFLARAFGNGVFFLWTGIALGLGLLTKYAAFVLIPIIFFCLVFTKRRAFSDWRLWVGVCLALLIFSPVIVYNIELYRRVGHFDFQFSYIFGQHPDVWKVTPGKDIGTLGERLSLFVPRLMSTYSWPFLALFLSAFFVFIYRSLKEGGKAFRDYLFLIISVVFLFALIVMIGPSFRFLSMFAPFLALWAACGVFWLFKKFGAKHFLATGVFAAFFIFFELFYSANSVIAYYPHGPGFWLWSKVREENYNWGYNALDTYFENEFQGKMPARVFVKKYEFLKTVQNAALEKAREEGREPYPALIVFDQNIFDFAKLWIFDRRFMYHDWPALTVETYQSFLKEQGSDYFVKGGFKNFYFVIPSGEMLLRKNLTEAAAGFETELLRRKASYQNLLNSKEKEAFRVYRF